jgi:16S rRNA G1207 methylase RsmC
MPPEKDDWGMTQETYEVEQDQHLRELRYTKAEAEAEQAIRHLTSCLEQKSWLIIIATTATITSMVMALIAATLLYGH